MNTQLPSNSIALSIVVPAYNAAGHILRNLTALTDQTESREVYQVIVVDDGSRDETLSICTAFAENHENIRVIHKENGGVSSARNAGLAAAEGKWVTFVDSDDFVTKDYVRTMVTTCPEAELVIFPHFQEQEGNLSGEKTWLCPYYETQADMARVHSWICDNLLNAPWDKRFCRDILRTHGIRFREGIHMGEDLLFNFTYVRHAASAYVCPQAVYIYTDNPQGLCRKPVSRDLLRQYETVYHEIRQNCDPALCRVLNLAYLRVLARYAGRLHRSGFSRQAIARCLADSEMVRSVLREPPGSVKNRVRNILLKGQLYRLCARLFR